MTTPGTLPHGRWVGLAAAVLGAASCARPASHAPEGEPSPRRVALSVAHVETLPLLYRTSGTVRGRNTTVLTSKATGYVRTVRVHAGDVVTAGQSLVELEANDVRAGVARARALLDQSLEAKAEAESALIAARVATRSAKTSYERAAALSKQGAISAQAFDDEQARWEAAEAQERAAEARARTVQSRIAEARAGVGEASATLGYADIAAPFAGRILERRVDPGALAAPGTPLLVIADEGLLRVEAAVEESRANALAVGDAADVEVDATPSALGAKIAEIVPSVDVGSRALLVKLDLPPDAGALRPGAFARVSFHVGTRERLVVPTTAVTRFGALDRVFVADGDRARLRMVTLGEPRGRWSELLSGLSAGERVVTAPPDGLRDGTPITEAP